MCPLLGRCVEEACSATSVLVAWTGRCCTAQLECLITVALGHLAGADTQWPGTKAMPSLPHQEYMSRNGVTCMVRNDIHNSTTSAHQFTRVIQSLPSQVCLYQVFTLSSYENKLHPHFLVVKATVQTAIPVVLNHKPSSKNI